MCSQDLNSLSLLTYLLLLLKYNTVNKYKIYWGDFVQGDFVLGGFCPGGFCPGDFVRGDFVLIPAVLTVFMFKSQLMQMPGPRDIVIYRPAPGIFCCAKALRLGTHISVQRPRGAWGGGGW